ncbi:MAG: hypothetical protein GY868_02670 [Deltaproteobacteria bacterium]|nr:hypothetical protein [Deltaproteobacteria bacterium]
MIRFAKHTLFFWALLLPLACIPDSGPGPQEAEEIQLDRALLSMPQSVSRPQTASRPTPAPGDNASSPRGTFGALADIYNPVREWFNPLANKALNFSRNLLQNMTDNIFSNKQLMQRLSDVGLVELTFDKDTQKARITRRDSTFELELWVIDSGVWLKHLNAVFVKNDTRLRGTVYVLDDTAGSGPQPLYRIEFDTEDPELGHIMELRATDLDYDDPDLAAYEDDYNIADRLWLKAYQKDDIFSIAANVYFKNIDIEREADFYPYVMKILNDGSPYVFGRTTVTANYIYRGTVEVIPDRGAVELALTPAAQTETDYVFSDYSIGSIYREAISNWIKSAVEDNVPLTTLLNTILEDTGSDLVLSDASPTDDIFNALSTIKDYFAARGESIQSINDILFIIKLQNPAYFDAESGFVGNDLIRRPDWADNLPVFDQINVLSSAEVSSDSFLFTMPGSANPDF